MFQSILYGRGIHLLLLITGNVSPLPLGGGLVVASQVIHSLLSDHTQVHITTWAQVTENTCSNGIPNQLLRLLQLKGERRRKEGGKRRGTKGEEVLLFVLITLTALLPDSAAIKRKQRIFLTSMFGLNLSSNTETAAAAPEPESTTTQAVQHWHRYLFPLWLLMHYYYCICWRSRLLQKQINTHQTNKCV